LQEELLRLQSELHKTIVFVTHDIDEAIRLGDRVCVLKVGGQIGQYDTPANLLAHPADAFVAEFLGEDRGVRQLAFLSSTGLAVADPAGTGPGWHLELDPDGRPRGWHRDGGELLPAGRTFTVGRDSLRSALDSAVLNPSGLGIGVDDDGRVLGCVHPDQVTA